MVATGGGSSHASAFPQSGRVSGLYHKRFIVAPIHCHHQACLLAHGVRLFVLVQQGMHTWQCSRMQDASLATACLSGCSGMPMAPDSWHAKHYA